jgi:hypothetical protein
MLQNITVGSRIDHDRYGIGVVSKVGLASVSAIFITGGEVSFSKTTDEVSIVELNEGGNSGGNQSLDVAELELMLRSVLDKYNGLQEIVPLGERWMGGKMIIQPKDTSLQSKEVPVETFFHKIVMLRDRLRVLEQNINTHPKLDDEDRINLQQYITRIYGSLTTFNMLFRDKEDHFKGQGGKD